MQDLERTEGSGCSLTTVPRGVESNHRFCLCCGKCFGWSGITAQAADRSSCSRSGGKLSQKHQPTFTPVIFAYACVHGAICGAACTCEYTSVSLQVECVHVCAFVRLFTGLFVSGGCRAHRRSARSSPPHSTQPLTRDLKYLAV